MAATSVSEMDRTCSRQNIEQVISGICTDVGQAAGLSNIDITEWTGGDVADSCKDDKVTMSCQCFGLSATTASKNMISMEKMFLYTNPSLVDREELFKYFMDAVGRREVSNNSMTYLSQTNEEQNEHSSFICEHRQKYRNHQHRILVQTNLQHAQRLQLNKELLTRLLMPHTLSTRFLMEIHRNVSHLLALLVAERSFHMVSSHIVTLPPIFDHRTEQLFRLSHLNEICVDVEACASSIQAQALNGFLPSHYACWDKDNPLFCTMQPLLDLYARNDVDRQKDDCWHDQIKQAYTMQDYKQLMRVDDILNLMVDKGDNVVPLLTDSNSFLQKDVVVLRFIVCLLFVIHVHNTFTCFHKTPLSFTRLDNPDNVIFHSPSSTHICNITPGQFFCYQGYLHIRPQDKRRSNIVLRSKCILSLFLSLFTE